jgi:hypothetical protein
VNGRVTGLQAALIGFVALLEAWREQLGPREYVVLLDLLARRVQQELERQGPGRGWWVA